VPILLAFISFNTKLYWNTETSFVLYISIYWHPQWLRLQRGMVELLENVKM